MTVDKEKKLNLVLLGGPGAGKGTQAEKLVGDGNLIHIATGDILREEVDRETDLGLQANEYMEKGELVPDELVVNMVEKRLNEDKGYVFDGFPRTVDQAEALGEVVDLDLVIYIKIDQEEAVRRLSSRRVCSDCGKIYNTIFKKPNREGICDECGGELYQRSDDSPKVIRERFNTFLEETAPLVEYYREKGLLEEVDGNGKPDEINSEIQEIISESDY